jgi:uncharacterized Zn finger protein (UPF0148 family)
MTCRDICVRNKVGKPSFGQGRYATGQKRCQICEIFIQWDGLMCPCCGYRLRLKPRNMKSKIRLLNDKNMQVKPKIPAISILNHKRRNDTKWYN